MPPPRAPGLNLELRIQLWSYNYEPEPTGIAPLSSAWAIEMHSLGHEVDVVAAHPHYPEPLWGSRLRPYVEERHGVRVLRLPIWVGRQTSAQRLRQELSFTSAATAALPFLGKADVVVAVSPSFPALVPAMLHARAGRTPWVLWLQDLLPEGAVVTGLIKPGRVLTAARWLERTAYRSTSHIIAISETFRDYLLSAGVPAERITRLYNPATLSLGRRSELDETLRQPRVLCMGNIGHSQGLVEIVSALHQEDQRTPIGARLEIAGTGVAATEVRAVAREPLVEMPGLLQGADLERSLGRATLGAVTQRYEGTEFNVPSKLMNYFACGIPVVASVRPHSEVARLIETSGAGWVTDAGEPAAFARAVRDALSDPAALKVRSEAALEYAQREFAPRGLARQAEAVLRGVLSSHA